MQITYEEFKQFHADIDDQIKDLDPLCARHVLVNALRCMGNETGASALAFVKDARERLRAPEKIREGI